MATDPGNRSANPASFRTGEGHVNGVLDSTWTKESLSFLADSVTLDMRSQQMLKADLLRSRTLLSERRLVFGAKWVSQLLPTIQVDMGTAIRTLKEMTDANPKLSGITSASYGTLGEDYETYVLAISYLDVKNYIQAANTIKQAGAKSPLCVFIRLYAMYLSAEQRILYETPVDPMEYNTHNKKVAYKEHFMLAQEMAKLPVESRDAFVPYLEGLICKRLGLNDRAREKLCAAIEQEPLNWNAWEELAALTHSVEILRSLTIPAHWMSAFFHLAACVDLHLATDALKIAEFLEVQHHFKDSLFIMAMKGQAFNSILSVPEGLEVFERIRKVDPYSLEYMDTLSNLFYVKEDRVGLTLLAGAVHEIDRYRRETLCVIANFYSLRSDHEKALQYFTRLLKVDPNYTHAWTLMGHEYIEVKNTAAAVQCYRKATELNPRDYRAWYGLGQAYEILKLDQYSLHFFQRAQALKPNDSRMLMALSGAYERLERFHEAKMAAVKALNVGDLEGAALLTVARLCDKQKDRGATAQAYLAFLNQCEQQPARNKESFLDGQAKANLFLAKYYYEKKALDSAFRYALKGTEFITTKEESKGILKCISEARGEVYEDPDRPAESSRARRAAMRALARASPPPLLDPDGDVVME